MQALLSFPKPIVAAVNGAAIGLGVALLPLCDIVYASDKATFSCPYSRLAQTPEGCATQTFPSVMGLAMVSINALRLNLCLRVHCTHDASCVRTCGPLNACCLFIYALQLMPCNPKWRLLAGAPNPVNYHREMLPGRSLLPKRSLAFLFWFFTRKFFK